MSENEDGATKGKDKGAAMNRKLLLERVHKITGGKMRDVKAVVEATLTVMGDALKAGEMLRLPPFGNARVRKDADEAAGSGMRVMLRGPKPGRIEKAPKAPKVAAAKPAKPVKAAGAGKAKKAKQPLAEPAEAD